MCAFCTVEAIDFSLQRPRCWDLSEFCKLLQGVRFSSSPNGTVLLEFVKLCAEPPDTLRPPPFCKKRGLGCFGKLLSLVSHLDPLYAPVHPWGLGARRPWPCPWGHILPRDTGSLPAVWIWHMVFPEDSTTLTKELMNVVLAG